MWTHYFRQYCRLSCNKWGAQLNTEIKIEVENTWKSNVRNSINKLKGRGKPYYVLSMFPYPSGNLHMGHVRVYTISDTIAHFYRMSGYDVIHPMGWDAFGLPAENASIERNIPPAKWTKDNIENMKMQLNNLGCCFDWEREINTSDPSYYKWTQVLFLELYKAGLAYKSEALVNWDPVDQTVLADEQVDSKGYSWRSGAKVEKKILNQWFLKTRKFAKELYDNLDSKQLEDWDDIIEIQKHWIGECSGTIIKFSVIHKCNQNIKFPKLNVWTNKPEALICAKFISLQSSHMLNKNELHEIVHPNCKELSVYAVNPINKELLKIYISDDIVYGEGTDSYLGSPSMCEEDQQFMSQIGSAEEIDAKLKTISDEDKLKLRKFVSNSLQKQNLGGYPVSSKLKDWLISRQRYWGTPIPMIHCNNCGTVPVPFEDLPVTFPEISVQGKIETIKELERMGWLETPCPKCKNKATRDTDTMDTFVDSSWYFLRYLDPKNNDHPFDPDTVSKSFPVDLYIGGKEHAVLHLYYARFLTHFLHSIGKVKVKEPFTRLLVQGMIMGRTYKIQETGKYIPETNVKIVDEDKKIAVTIDDNKKVKMVWEKMSKSKYNGVDPTTLFDQHGCDTTRLFVLSDVSPRSSKNWSNRSFSGILNWQSRVWTTVSDFLKYRNMTTAECNSPKVAEFDKEFWNIRNRNIIQVTYNYAHTHNLNVVISRLQALTKSLKNANPLIRLSAEYERCLGCLILMIAPMAPHFASELWSGFVNAPGRIDQTDSWFSWKEGVFEQTWPVVDPDYLLHLTCRINGNDMGQIPLKPSELNQLTETSAMDHIFNHEKIGSKVRKQFIAKTSLDIYTNCFAVFNFTMDYTQNKS